VGDCPTRRLPRDTDSLLAPLRYAKDLPLRCGDEDHRATHSGFPSHANFIIVFAAATARRLGDLLIGVEEKCKEVITRWPTLPEMILGPCARFGPHGRKPANCRGGTGRSGSSFKNGCDSPAHCSELQMRIALFHVLARVIGQFLTDLERNVGVGHRRVEAVSERMELQPPPLCWREKTAKLSQYREIRSERPYT
jgi:hypothetical protein